MSKRSSIVRIADPRWVQSMQGIRRSSAAGAHDPRPNRKRSRGDARRAAIAEYR